MLFQMLLKLSPPMHNNNYVLPKSKVAHRQNYTYIYLTLFDNLISPEPSDFKQCTSRLIVFHSSKTEPFP